MQRDALLRIFDKTVEKEKRQRKQEVDPDLLAQAEVAYQDWLRERGEPRMRSLTYPLVVGTGTEAVQQIGTQLGISFQLDQAGLLDYARRETMFLAGVMGQTTGTAVADTMQRGLENGLTFGGLRKELEQLPAFDRWRAALTARTETTRAWNGAQRDQMQNYQEQTGRRVTKIWVSSRDDRVREEHMLLDGEQAEIDAEFSNGLENPGEPNCRCTLTYQTSDRIEQGEPVGNVEAVEAPPEAQTPGTLAAFDGDGKKPLFDKDGNIARQSIARDVRDLWKAQDIGISHEEFFRRAIAVPDDWRVELSRVSVWASNDGMFFEAILKDAAGTQLGLISREFDFVAKSVKHDLFVIAEAARNQGIGKRILAEQFALYDTIGITTVNLHAALDVGGYAWARYGFVPRLSQEWTNLKRYASKKLDTAVDQSRYSDELIASVRGVLKSRNPADIRLLASNPLGKELLLGSDWNGTFDLTDTASRSIFNSYVAQ